MAGSKIKAQKQKFYETVLPAWPNEWEITEIFDRLELLDSGSREMVLSQVEVLWPVSHSLCIAYMTEAIPALQSLPRERLGDWIRCLLDVYEKQGLSGARQFMADVEHHLVRQREPALVRLDDIGARMTHFLNGIGGKRYELGVADLPATDTSKVYLPDSVEFFTDLDANRLVYKLLAALQWANIETGLYREITDISRTAGDLDRIEQIVLSGVDDGKKAMDLLRVLQFLRAYQLVKLDLPGLFRDSRSIVGHLVDKLFPRLESEPLAQVMNGLLVGATGAGERLSAGCNQWLPEGKLLAGGEWIKKSALSLMAEFYPKIADIGGSLTFGSGELLLGRLDFRGGVAEIRKTRRDDRGKFVLLLADHLNQATTGAGPEQADSKKLAKQIEGQLAVVLQKSEAKSTRRQRAVRLVIDNRSAELSDELVATMNRIQNDLGVVPEAYVQAAVGMAGHGVHRLEEGGGGVDRAAPPRSQFVYDEWDYRRAGYRRDWCTLYEKPLTGVKSQFVVNILARYAPLLKKLKYRFEMLRSRERYARRRRHGDDIDLDALIDALGDVRAGLVPSDRLFVRLIRDERDVGTCFLVDMSNSTEGWVGTAIKESLVLLAQSLEAAGDPYGIYGFSGMRRLKSEFYNIKEFTEPYSLKVEQKIAAMKPMEFTRMGPPIRHLTKKMMNLQNRVRLLVVISDGKPEDYDDYKGRYAIEDTRKALLEAKGMGIHVFCITVDKQAQQYLPHMFGRSNYVVVDNVSSLPLKLVNLYRMLTG
ncbi:nitric oxide reductase activation protein NorD [Desulforhopalus singaporensis]|uniref:Nitric oxide reductase NorD protein n=1 Tax=Desulforhopalus singaporensis TaxID=91360 RepID=A0A1H0MIW3_9BACT|nr:VWA domain-containing protein [Desulforhopalus singaporensis]SDO80383.1 nitric oxide reductase NorD protein [Desulforhopalus singaporensis]